MSQHRSDDSWIGMVIGAVVALGFAMVWSFSQFFGLDMATGWAVLWRMGLLLGLVVVCWKYGDEVEFLRLSQSWPIWLALFSVCWWPALDFWAGHQRPSFLGEEQVVLWWNAWYTKLGAMLTIGGAPYLVRRAWDD